MLELLLCIFIFSILILFVNYRAMRWRDRAEIQTRVRKRPEYGYIYFYRGKGENIRDVKIGRAKDWFQRLRASRTSVSPRGFHIYGIVMVKDDVMAETLIHRKFADRRYTKKNEWFRMNLALYLYIRRVRDMKLTREARESLALD